MPPLVSVVVTTYNHARYIGAALRSVLEQSYDPYEVIVVDDGSLDGTGEEIERFRDRVLKVWQPNQGIAASRNTGVRHARGELVAFLDGDDLWKPQKLSLQVDAALRHPRSGAVVVDGIQFDERETLRGSLMSPYLAGLLAGRESITLPCYERLLQTNLITTLSQVMVPKRVLDRVGPSDTRFRVSSDWDLYLRISLEHEITFLNQNLMGWRYLESSASGPEHRRLLAWAQDEIEILKKHLRLSTPEIQNLIRRLLTEKLFRTSERAYYHGLEADWRWSRRYLLRLLRRNPTSVPVLAYLVALQCPRSVTQRLAPIARTVTRWR
jgi:glycosyltransferase involved in cell wall biosynthesis